MSSNLIIVINDIETNISYRVDNQNLITHTHDVGLIHLEKDGLSKVATGKFVEGIIYALEYISLYERIPHEFILITPKYATWLKGVLENQSYTQFYTNGLPVRVKIESSDNASFSYARHKKAIFSFKV